jgi:hypothetical protein
MNTKLYFAITMGIRPSSAYEGMRIYYIINVVKLLHVSATFCGHLQGGFFTTVMLQRQQNQCANTKI